MIQTSRPYAIGSAQAPAEPCVLVVFGASGDLTKRLLVPALYNLSRTGLLPEHLAIVGVDAVQQDAAVEDGLRDAAGNDPKLAAGHKQLVEGKRITAGIPGERYIGQPVRNGDADLGAGGL